MKRTIIMVTAAAWTTGVSAANIAAADDAIPFSAERLEPAERGSAFFVVDPLSSEAGPTRAVFGTTLGYSRRPLVISSTFGGIQGASVNVGSHAVGASLGASVGLPYNFRIGLSAPLTLIQAGETTTIARYTYPQTSGAAVGDLRFNVDYRWLNLAHVRGAVGARLYAPTGGQDAYAGEGSTRLTPRVLLSGDLGPVTIATDAGVALRKARAYGDIARGNEFVGSLGVGYRSRDNKLTIGPEVTLAYLLSAEGATSRPDAALEALLGGHLQSGPFLAGLGYAHGLTTGLGTPTWRVLASVDVVLELHKKVAPAPPAPEPTPIVVVPPTPPPAAAAPVPEESPIEPRAIVEAPPKVPATPVEQPITRYSTNEWRLTTEDQKVLEGVLTILKADASATVTIRGHADIVGTTEYNQKLSEKRANEAAEWLRSRGIDPARIQQEAFGSAKPVASNETEEGRAKNRRVEIVVNR